MGGMAADPTYRITVVEQTGADFRYRVERSFTPDDPLSWTRVDALGSTDDGMASSSEDAVFGEDVYIFKNFWNGSPAEVGDTFTFSVDRYPTLISLPVLLKRTRFGALAKPWLHPRRGEFNRERHRFRLSRDCHLW